MGVSSFRQEERRAFTPKRTQRAPLPGSSSLTVGFRKISGTEGSAPLSLPLFLSLSHTQALHTSPETPEDMQPCPPVTLTLPCHRYLHTHLFLPQQAKLWRESWLGTAPSPLGIEQGGEAKGSQTSSHQEGETQLTQTPGPRPRHPRPWQFPAWDAKESLETGGGSQVQGLRRTPCSPPSCGCP